MSKWYCYNYMMFAFHDVHGVWSANSHFAFFFYLFVGNYPVDEVINEDLWRFVYRVVDDQIGGANFGFRFPICSMTSVCYSVERIKTVVSVYLFGFSSKNFFQVLDQVG